MTDNFISPFVDGLSKLLKSDGYPSLLAMYEAEEKIIVREIANAKDDRALTICQGKLKMLHKLYGLPEVTIDRYLNQKKGENK